MKDYIVLRPHRDCIVTPRLITSMIGFMTLFSAALIALSS
jgi:hypothetical protein